MYDTIKIWIDQSLGGLNDALSHAVDYIHQASFTSGSLNVFTSYLSWLNLLPGVWKALLVSLIACLQILLAVYAGYGLYSLYLKLKAGIKWW